MSSVYQRLMDKLQETIAINYPDFNDEGGYPDGDDFVRNFSNGDVTITGRINTQERSITLSYVAFKYVESEGIWKPA